MTIEELVKQAVKEVVSAKLKTEETEEREEREEEEEIEVAEAPVEQLQSSAKSGI